MKKGPTNALESTFMGLGGPINCQRQDHTSYTCIMQCEFMQSQQAYVAFSGIEFVEGVDRMWLSVATYWQ